MADEQNVTESFNESLLSESERKDFNFVKTRLIELKESRQSHYGVDLDKLWAEADKNYTPHRLKPRVRQQFIEDETLGWRGPMTNLGSTDWQSDIANNNPFVKIQTALATLIDQNPEGVFTPSSKKFEATTALTSQLYHRSWEFAESKAELKKFVYNLAKYGWACARTYPLKKTVKVKVLKDEFDAENLDNNKYEEKEVVEYNDIMRENLDPRNVWIDDMARPNNKRSVRDWAWRKVYSYESAEKEFGDYKNWQYIKPGGVTSEVVGPSKKMNKKLKTAKLVEVYFYENVEKDLFTVHINGVPIINSPLIIEDAKGNKKLSLWQTYWNLRHAESVYGIGIYEAMRYDNAMLDRFRNMTIDQITLAIYKMFFYTGTGKLTETGDIVVTPGLGKQVLDPKNINWMEVPGPGADAYKGLEILQKSVDDSSGLGDELIGKSPTGKKMTAFQMAQLKEAALKRIKIPLDNILECLNEEAYITLSLIDLMYSVPEVHEISDKQLIEDYLKEVGSDPAMYDRSEDGKFQANIYREFPLNLEKNESGKLETTKETKFFRVHPKYLKWEGIVSIKSTSLLTPSKQVDRAMETELFNILGAALQGMAQERLQITSSGGDASIDNLTLGKSMKNLLKTYDKDYKDIFPDSWLKEQQQPQQKQQPLIIQPGQGPGQPGMDQMGKLAPNPGMQQGTSSGGAGMLSGKLGQ